ncbi:MAG: DNA repair protein RecN [Bacteroidaceae bacterium]|nr:DNA repair protein RecN [Bacteroidaceae bacterium]
MLQSLHIQNYALIDQLDISFEKGFSVITGETGAGKSILLGAIGLLLGQRADMKMLKAGAQRCVIEAEFDLTDYDFADYFTTHDLDFDGHSCIIRRELTSTGKSRAFINDTPTSLNELKELGDQLIDIHSQHQNLLLNKENFQLQVLDALAQDSALLDQYKQNYKEYCQLRDELESKKAQSDKDKEEQEYLAFQLKQLQEAQLSVEEEQALEQELTTLEHAEEIKTALYQCNSILNSEQNGLIDQMRDVKRKLESMASVYPPAQELAERMDSCYIEVRDIADEVESDMETMEFDPERLNYVNERISTIHSLKQKFHADDIEELIQIEEELAERLSLIDNSDEYLLEMQRRITQHEKELDKMAVQLTKQRTTAASKLEGEMCSRLVALGIPNVQFQVNIQTEKMFSPTGRDKIVYLFSANKNIPMQPLSQVASGGEMARLMLVLKAIISSSVKLPTIIFDEIDTGVSGHIAEKMAHIMQEMGTNHHRQVISITHLPQIAALGEQHYRVYKTDSEDTTTSHIVRLTPEERIEEVAHMLSGSTLTEAAIANAKSLLGTK